MLDGADLALCHSLLELCPHLTGTRLPDTPLHRCLENGSFILHGRSLT